MERFRAFFYRPWLKNIVPSLLKMEALAYDTMKLVLGILEDAGIATRNGFASALLATKNFQGATGNISFGGNRVAQKEAVILKVQGGEIVQVMGNRD